MYKDSEYSEDKHRDIHSCTFRCRNDKSTVSCGECLVLVLSFFHCCLDDIIMKIICKKDGIWRIIYHSFSAATQKKIKIVRRNRKGASLLNNEVS